MTTKKRWHFWLIVSVLTLTVYNILPTVFFYTKPLGRSIDSEAAKNITLSLMARVNSLEQDAINWINSYCKGLGISPTKIELNVQNPEMIAVSFGTEKEAMLLRTYLPKAGRFISFAPAELSLVQEADTASRKVFVRRKISIHFDPKNAAGYYQFSSIKNTNGEPQELYKQVIIDRAVQLGLAISNFSENAKLAQTIIENPTNPQIQELATLLSQKIIQAAELFGEDSKTALRFYRSLGNGQTNTTHFAEQFAASLATVKDRLRVEKIALQKELSLLPIDKNESIIITKQKLDLLSSREPLITRLEKLIRKYAFVFQTSLPTYDETTLVKALSQSSPILHFQDHNPLIEELSINWAEEKIVLKLHADVLLLKKQLYQKPSSHYLKNQIDQIIYNEISTVSRLSSESILPLQDHFILDINTLKGAKSVIVLPLSTIARQTASSLKTFLLTYWHPRHIDLKESSFPIWDYETYSKLPEEDRNFGLLIYAPRAQDTPDLPLMKPQSIYIVARGLDKMIAHIEKIKDETSSREFIEDLRNLQSLLQQEGFYGYSGKSPYVNAFFAHDYLFEKEDYYQDILTATREDFYVRGTKKFAVLELADVKERMLVENKIEDATHETLLKWRDDYRAASLGIKGMSPHDIAKPTRNVFWSNIQLSWKKFFHGDERKILHWGLDLSGGKTVQIQLSDSNSRIVTKEADLRQGMNELYHRINKMGVSEVSIRQEGNSISIDFPGSQELSAAELIKASTMYFHVVNERFSSKNQELATHIEQFLQDIWNEAVITGHKEIEEINTIAWRHIHGDSLDPSVIEPRSVSAKILHEQGLRLGNPQDPAVSSAFDDTLSKITLLRGEDFTDWGGRSHPLLIVFRNFALEGSSLENVMASYDPSKGNFILFDIKTSRAHASTAFSNPRDDLEAWTTKFCKERLALGSPLAQFSQGDGWRMAIVLNGSIISAPTLSSPLRNSASITGSFTQRELSALEADLKAGSLSFTPKILSEKNVSPELGLKEKKLGIIGMFISLSLVIISMVSMYYFGGVIASIAVILNLFLMWATLQNIHATISLAGIAGVILTLGMAVDANVLVFERIREEFAVTKKLSLAIQTGYRKAFSAIFDANITTLIAALILLNFESGPIRAIAVTLIIGLVSSMFTALFMTRYFFIHWAQRKNTKTLKMARFLRSTQFQFLHYIKPTMILSMLVIVIGGYLALSTKNTFLGMDFTGGYAVSIEIEKQGNNTRQEIEQALLANGATSQEIIIRQLSPSNYFRLFLASSMEEKGHPFYGMRFALDDKDAAYPYVNNPRLLWVVNALEKANISIQPTSLPHLGEGWSSISGQMSDTMRNQALIGLMIALICILVYITIRFEFTYAASATLCLIHDILFTLSAMAILHTCGVPVQLDLHTVAALMTIVGYSLNDTIIIFDRIREDLRNKGKQPVVHIVNQALNVTLSRTLMTSGTTLLVLIPLIILGGSTVFSFALVMAIGVVFGTLSSLFVASPLMLYFYRRQEQTLST